MSQPSPLLAVRQRAESLAGSADLAAAIMVLEDGVDAGKSRLGEDDPEVLTTAHQLARVHLQADDPSAARRVLEEAYAAGQWRLGDTDPLMLEISFDLGVVAEELGNRHEARKAFTRVAETGPAILGGDHWAVRRAQAYLGSDPSAVRAEQATATLPPIQQPPVHQDPYQQAPVQPPSSHQDLHQRATTQQAPFHQDLYEQDSILQPPRQQPPAQQPPLQRPQLQQPGLQQPAAQQNPAQQNPAHLFPTPQAPSHHPSSWPATSEPRLTDPSLSDTVQFGAIQDALTEPTVAQQAIVPVRHTVTPPPPHEHLLVVPINADLPRNDGARRDSYGRRGSVIFAAIAACLAAIIAVVALVFVLASRGGNNDKDDTPVLAGAPPTGVDLDDQGTRVALSWTDPAGGTTTFLVTGGHPGELLKPMGQTGPGAVAYTLNGLNDKLDYCFAIVAVYSTTQFATSPQVCTSRPRPAPTQ